MDYTGIQSASTLNEPNTLVDKIEADLLDYFNTYRLKAGDAIPKQETFRNAMRDHFGNHFQQLF